MIHNVTIRKALLWIAILALSIMVIALGAAAKHSQFVGPMHSTHYLAQAVKMVNDTPVDFACPVPFFFALLFCLPATIIFFLRCTLKTKAVLQAPLPTPLRV